MQAQASKTRNNRSVRREDASARSTTSARRREVRDSYLNLIRRFPLRPIRSEREYDEATNLLQSLIGRKLDSGEADYLDALLMFVNCYEETHHELDESMTPADAIRALMSANDLTQAELGRIIGSQSAVSMILSGARQPSKAQIAKLCDSFRLSADLFIGRAA